MTPKSSRMSRRIKPFALALLLILAATLLVAFFPQLALADPDWYNADWTYRKPITIDYEKVNGMQTNLLVLINLWN